jgi:nicotinamide-nucleotide amidase
MSYDEDILEAAARLIDRCRQRRLVLATAESCTGGLVAGALTAVPGASEVFDCGFVTYSNEAKTRMLGVPPALIAGHGAVSREVASAMADGAITHSTASLAIAVTGIAGPGGGSTVKPVGLVHWCAAARGGPTVHEELRLGDIGREAVRLASVRRAIALLDQLAARMP